MTILNLTTIPTSIFAVRAAFRVRVSCWAPFKISASTGIDNHILQQSCRVGKKQRAHSSVCFSSHIQDLKLARCRPHMEKPRHWIPQKIWSGENLWSQWSVFAGLINLVRRKQSIWVLAIALPSQTVQGVTQMASTGGENYLAYLRNVSMLCTHTKENT